MAIISVKSIEFLSTPSARRATVYCRGGESHHRNFYPRPPRGGRHAVASRLFESQQFLSTPSARRATAAHEGLRYDMADFYPRPPRGGRHSCVMGYITIFTISIHALREEGDTAPYRFRP